MSIEPPTYRHRHVETQMRRMHFQMVSREWFRGNVVRLFMPPDYYEAVPRKDAALHDRLFHEGAPRADGPLRRDWNKGR